MEPENLNIWKHKESAFKNAALAISAITDIGLKRKTNQDRYLVRQFSDDTVLLAVADGLGGEPGGEIASDHVIEALSSLGNIDFDDNGDSNLLSFFHKIDRELWEMSKEDMALDGMATTLTTVLIKDNTAHWFHSGDSRLYHIRDDRLTQITKDQTLASFLIEEGEITKEESLFHYSKQILEQCIGCYDLTPANGQLSLKAGDMLILVSDGLYRYVSDETIFITYGKFRNGADPDSMVMTRSLVNIAVDAGGKDNITVVIAIVRA